MLLTNNYINDHFTGRPQSLRTVLGSKYSYRKVLKSGMFLHGATTYRWSFLVIAYLTTGERWTRVVPSPRQVGTLGMPPSDSNRVALGRQIGFVACLVGVVPVAILYVYCTVLAVG